MFNRVSGAALLVIMMASVAVTSVAGAADISGHYLESRTCDVYTGPCFAKGETGLAGKNAVMAWSIATGTHAGVDLAGLKVVMALNASDTLGFAGINDAKQLKSVIYVDEKASDSQHNALVAFAKQHAGRAGQAVVKVSSAPIEMTLDEGKLIGKLDVAKKVKLVTRKAGLADCICSNETAYYPPLAKVEFSIPGVATIGQFTGSGLGTRWSTPGARSTYMATFAY